MSSLFYLPKVTSLPSSKLYFYRTETSTPQDVYTDEGLDVAHEVPVEADAAGVFPPIYLDPTLPAYRVSHYTSADVLIYTVDDVPSNQNVQQSMRLESTNPFLFLYDTDGTSGSRKYRVRASGNAFEVQASNDAEDTFTTILQFTGGVLYSNATEVAVTVASTFTGTLTGCTTSPTATFNYRKVNNIVTLWTDANLLGVSNTTAMTITGVPAAIRPTTQKSVGGCDLTDNSIAVVGTAYIGTGGAITFGVDTVSGTKIIPSVFTNSNNKGINTGWCVVYPLS
jgi:hypothetical protein